MSKINSFNADDDKNRNNGHNSNNNNNRNNNSYHNDDGLPIDNIGGGTGSGRGGKGGGIPVINMGNQNQFDPMDYLIDYNQKARDNKFDKAKFREDETTALLSVLSTIKHPNALLIGDAGVGKTQIVENLAILLVNQSKLVKNALGSDLEIYELPLSGLIAGAGIVGELEKRLNAIIDFLKEDGTNRIVFIDEIHQLFKEGGSSATNNIANILKPALSRGDLHVIGATTTNESRDLRSDPAFQRRFTNIMVPELSNEQTFEILKDMLPTFNAKHHLDTKEDVLGDVISYANQYLTDSHRPDTALTLLDRASAMLNIKQQKMNISNSRLTVNAIKQAAMAVLNHKQPTLNSQKLRDALGERIIGQDRVLDEVTDQIRRYSLGLNVDKRPLSMLFAGPTGTGKSEIAKQIAKYLFGDDHSIINLNMTEYTDKASLNRLLGSDAGYVGSTSNEERPLDDLANNKFQVVLLDEFEKCHPTVQRTFMQALDEGFIRDHSNRVIDFSKAVIIATTNAGAEELQSSASIGFSNHAQSVTDLNDSHAITEILKKSYPIELLNRFQTVISFNTLSKADYKQILKVMFNQLAPQIEKQVHLRFSINHLDLDVDYDFIDALADKSYEPAYNGRPARRSITNLLEDSLIANQNQYQVEIIKQSK